MRIFALGDPHLSLDASGNLYKPMDIFGEHWQWHAERIKNNWLTTIGDSDVVLIPGDISWALKLEDAAYDLNYLGQLPGLKILAKGNHDLWWQSISKVRQALPGRMLAIQNDHVLIGNIAICGTRGWTCPGDKYFDEVQDRKIYERELHRLRLSLESVTTCVKERIVMLHYPPTNGRHEPSEFIELLQEFGVKKCIYGHLHAQAIKGALPREKWGINFYLASADAIEFTPLLIKE